MAQALRQSWPSARSRDDQVPFVRPSALSASSVDENAKISLGIRTSAFIVARRVHPSSSPVQPFGAGHHVQTFSE